MEDILIYNFTILKFKLLQRVEGLLAATSFQANGLPFSNTPQTHNLYERNALGMMKMMIDDDFFQFLCPRFIWYLQQKLSWLAHL